MTLRLPQVLDTRAAPALLDALRAARGAPLLVDASEVDRLGALCLQAMVAARLQWTRDGHEFSVIAASTAFADGVLLAAAHDLSLAENAA